MSRIHRIATFIILFTTAIACDSCVKRDAGSFQTTSGCQGGVQPRLEVHELQKNEDQWNIFVLAMQSFQQQNYTELMSYYQIAGIHGQPYIEWDGVGRCTHCALTGYCCHSSPLFPTWHRLYGALFEQSLQINAIAVARTFQGDDQQRYLNASMQLRMPYWDWALPVKPGQAPFPAIFTDATVNVKTPSGPQTIPNPFLEFKFPAGADHSFIINPGRGTTVRRSTLDLKARQQLRADTWTLLTSQHVYEAFSTEALEAGSGENPNSLEALHDQIHILLGGDMANIPSAAFDTIFFFHHINVDRLLAIWQTLNPHSWLTPWKEVSHTLTFTTGTMMNSTSPLTPFRSDATLDFWDTDTARTTQSLGYEYPEIASGDPATAANLVNTLYRNNATSTKTRRSIESILGAYASPGKVHEYVANVRADSMGTCGSFTVFIFDGDFDDGNPDGWHNEGNLTGYHGFFTGPEAKGTGNALVNAGISITHSLLQDVQLGWLSDMSPSCVTNYLRRSISWRVQLANGTVIPAEEVPGLEVAIMTSPVQLPTSGFELPSWGQWQFLTEVTQNKTNGYNGGGLLGFLRPVEQGIEGVAGIPANLVGGLLG